MFFVNSYFSCLENRVIIFLETVLIDLFEQKELEPKSVDFIAGPPLKGDRMKLSSNKYINK